MNKILLSPPFSNIKLLSSYKNTTRITGTYTLSPRPGLYRVLTTLRKIKGGWVNKVGLRNPGILKANSGIVSIAEINVGDFEKMLNLLEATPNIEGVELNISCPNIDAIELRSEVLAVANRLFENVIVKVPHDISDDKLYALLEMGDFIIHVSNTKASPRGGISGRSLINRNISTIKKIKTFQAERKVIGGGGIYDLEVAKLYFDCGADFLSISTLLLNPYRAIKLMRQIESELL